MEKVFLGRFGNMCIYNDGGFLTMVENDKTVEKSDFRIENLGDFHEFYLAKNDDGFGLVKNDGSILVDFGKYDILSSIQYDVNFMGCKAIIKVVKEGKMGLIGNNGEELLSPIYDDICFVLNCTMVKIRQGDNTKLVFNDGKIIELWDNYDSIEYYGKDFYKVSRVEDYVRYFGLINKFGEEVVPCMYTCVSEIECDGEKIGFFLVDHKELHGVFDERGNEIVPTIFENIFYLPEGFFKVDYSNDECGVYDLKGNTIVPYLYKSVIRSYKDSLDGFLVLTQDYLWGWYDNSGKKRIEPGFSYIHNNLRVFGDCFVTVEKNLCGVITPDGKQILKNKYLSIKPVIYEGGEYVEVETMIFRIKKYVDNVGQEYRRPYIKGD